MDHPESRSRAYRVYLWTGALTSLFFTLTFTVNNVYYIIQAQLDPLQLVLIGTALELAVFLFEVPTGIVADLVSRRLSVIIGYSLVGAGFLLQALVPSFAAILAAQVLWGLGYTFTSGAQQAWLSDEIGEDNANHAFVKAAQLEQVGALVGAATATMLGAWQLVLPMAISGVGFLLLSLALINIMPENHFSPTPRGDRSAWQSMLHTLHAGLGMMRRRPELAGVLAAGVVYGLYSEGFDRLWTIHLLENFTLPAFLDLPPVVWVGGIEMVGMVLGFFVLGALHHRLQLAHARPLVLALVFFSSLLVGGLAFFALSGSFWLAVASLWLISAMRDLIAPLHTAWVNQRLDPQVRATVLSMSGQMDAIGQIAGGPFVGVIGRRSLRAGILASTALLTPVLPILLANMRKDQPKI